MEEFCKGDELLVQDYQEFRGALERAKEADKLIHDASTKLNQM